MSLHWPSWVIRICLRRFDRYLNVLSHSSHRCWNSLLCLSMWSFRAARVSNFIWHVSQVYLKEFACLLLCLFRSALTANAAPHCSHTWLLVSSWTLHLWRLRLAWEKKILSQQEYGPDFLCRDSCCRSVDVLEKTFPQNLHTPGSIPEDKESYVTMCKCKVTNCS